MEMSAWCPRQEPRAGPGSRVLPRAVCTSSVEATSLCWEPWVQWRLEVSWLPRGMKKCSGEFGTSAVRLSQLLPWVSHGLGPRQTFSRGTQVGFSVVRSVPEHTGTSFLKRDLLWPRLEVFPRPCHSLSCGGSGVTFPPVLQSSVLTQQV